jgi:hypothetical protein
MIAEPGGLLVQSLGREVLSGILDDQIIQPGHQPERSAMPIMIYPSVWRPRERIHKKADGNVLFSLVGNHDNYGLIGNVKQKR